VLAAIQSGAEPSTEEQFSTFKPAPIAETVRSSSGELRTKCQACGYLNAESRKS